MLEHALFGHRRLVLGLLIAFTVAMGWFAVKLRMDAGFEKQLPVGHEYIATFNEYRDDLLGANRLTIVVKARKGTIWTTEGLKRLYDVTQAVTFLPYVSRSSVQSLWTPNSFVNEITEEGFRADPLIPGTVTPDRLDATAIGDISRSTAQGGFVGSLVSRDQTSAMVTADLNEVNASGKRIDYVSFDRMLESELRKKFEDDKYEIQIIGFAKQIGDIAEGAAAVLQFCLMALLLTALAVYWYCRSIRLTILPLSCSLFSLIWQFGTLYLLGYGLDPLGVLVPFLVFAIGVSHGVQQINFIVREISHGKSVDRAARSSFSGLLVPGTLALITAFVSFATLVLVPIPMVRELAITASLGVAYKIITNLVMLPLAASMLQVDAAYAKSMEARAVQRARWLHVLARVASGNAGVLAATNEVIEHSELPMMLYVYATIVLLVFLAYRDVRAVLACCLPLTIGTFIGYWFMKELEIGLTVGTLPVMVLAVGIGVDYAFYIYTRCRCLPKRPPA
nr:MMPL family transporter [Ralstonia mannitolilytica]